MDQVQDSGLVIVILFSGPAPSVDGDHPQSEHSTAWSEMSLTHGTGINTFLLALTGFLLLALLPAPSSCHPAAQNIHPSSREINNNEEILVF